MKQEKTLSDKIVKQDLYYTKTGGMINDFIFTEDVKEAIKQLKEKTKYLCEDEKWIEEEIDKIFGSRLVEEK